MIYIRKAGYLYLLTICLTLPISGNAKPACKDKLEKLHNIQSMQRQSSTNNRSASLRKREDKARKAWWQCEHTSTASLKKKQSKNKSKANKNRVTHSKVNKANKKESSQVIASKINPFKTSRAIVVKGKYTGGKQSAWLAFYRQPSQCQQSKNLQVFAYCSENKQQQQQSFEQQFSIK